MVSSLHKKQDKSWYRHLAESSDEWNDYEPLCLWLIPIMLRSRREYYADAAARTRKLIEWYWESSGPAFQSRSAFDKSKFVQGVWDRDAPKWWGLNDIVGWLDIRLCVRSRQFQVSIFLPTKRISKQLKDKVYYCITQESVSLPDRSTNEELQRSLIVAVEKLSKHPVVQKHSLDLTGSQRLVRHTDLIGIIRETAEADMKALLSEEEKS